MCDDSFNDLAASIICGAVDIGTGGQVTADRGGGHGPIWLDDVDCAVGAAALDDCDQSEYGEHNCDHGEDVWIMCVDDEDGGGEDDSTPCTPEGGLRLVEGTADQGRLEICHDGIWGKCTSFD